MSDAQNEQPQEFLVKIYRYQKVSGDSKISKEQIKQHVSQLNPGFNVEVLEVQTHKDDNIKEVQKSTGE